MSASDLDAEISKKEKEISTAESNFKVSPVLFCLPHCSLRESSETSNNQAATNVFWSSNN
jgi:hypothetical protein